MPWHISVLRVLGLIAFAPITQTINDHDWEMMETLKGAYASLEAPGRSVLMGILQ